VRRREFLGTLGGAAAWPLVASAQQPARMARVGVSLSGSVNDGNTQRMLAAFKKGMQTLGWIEGQNIRYEVYWGDGSPERIASNAKELVNAAPDALLTVGTPTTAALRREAGSIPIVFTVVSDPVGDGFVESLSRPGGNVTGFITFYPEIVGKWLGTLKELAPQVKRTALIFNPRTARFAKSGYLRPQFEQAARRFAVEPIMSPVHDLAGIKMSIDAVAHQPGGSLLVMPDSFMLANRMSILELNARLRVPAMYPFSVFCNRWGPHRLWRRHGRAESPRRELYGPHHKRNKAAALPVQAPTKFELVINLRIAKALALTVPPTLLAIANKVID
jgi:ABC-type uncharacterized transport system substrate-binding protein